MTQPLTLARTFPWARLAVLSGGVALFSQFYFSAAAAASISDATQPLSCVSEPEAPRGSGHGAAAERPA